MPHIVWRPQAREDLRRIIDFVSDRNIAAALRLATLFEQAAERLADHPYMHRAGRVPGTREAVVHPNYIMTYRVHEAVEIVSIFHTRQQYP